MEDIKYRPIGSIRTPFKKQAEMPIQPSGAQGVQGTIKVKKEYIAGLKDLEGFSHVILIYHFHLSQGYSMHVTPFLDNQLRGVFATRAPRRPNAVGLSVVKLNAVEKDTLKIENVDMVDGTPLLDIKPYVPEFDAQTDVKTGWLAEAKKQVKQVKSDKRFNSSKKA